MPLVGDNSEGVVVGGTNPEGPRSVVLFNNKSNQELVGDDCLEAGGSRISQESSSMNHRETTTQRAFSAHNSKITKGEWLTVIVLLYVNLINFMDRFVLDGISDHIQFNFDIDHSKSGLLQTVFLISFIISALIFGYLGDRRSRKWIMAGGVSLSSLSTLWGSFTDQSFGLLVLSRAFFGIGQASFSVIAPTVIGDMFTHNLRSKMLVLFYLPIPVGSGLGYIVGSKAARFAGDWRWALRVTPILGVIAVFLIIYVIVDPPRGESERLSSLKATSYSKDLKDLFRIKSFTLTTLGFTCVTFVTEALAWWFPTLISTGLTIQKGSADFKVSPFLLMFGIINLLSWLLGISLGSFVAQKFRAKNVRADPLTCGFGLLISTPLIILALVVAKYNTAACFTLLFFGELFLNLSWVIVIDILLYVVIPTKRCTAVALQILFSKLFGDSSSPYLIGVVFDWLKGYLATEKIVAEDPVVTFKSLQYALFITWFVEILGGVLFLMSARYIVADRTNCHRISANSAEYRNAEGQPKRFEDYINRSLDGKTISPGQNSMEPCRNEVQTTNV